MKQIALILGLSAAALIAQAEPTPDAMKAAGELVVTMGLDKQFKGGLSPMAPIIENMARRMQLNEADTAELKGIYQAWFSEDVDREKLLQSAVRMYADSFTTDELKQLDAFYKSPIGLKMLSLNPELMQKSSQAGAEEMRAKQVLLQQRLQPFLEKHRPAGAPVPVPAPVPGPVPKPAQ